MTGIPGNSQRWSLDPSTESIIVSGGHRSPAAGSRSGTVVRVIGKPVVSQPPPFSSGQTVVVPRTRIEIGGRSTTGAAGGVVEKLNQMNFSRDELVTVLESLTREGIYRGGVIYKN